MLRIKSRDIPQFRISDAELTCSGGTPGTWKETEHINSGSGPNFFTNKTPYRGTIYYKDNSGHSWNSNFEPNERVSISSNATSSYIVMKGGAKKSSDFIHNEEGRDQK